MTGKMITDGEDQTRDWLALNKAIDEIAYGQIPCRQAPDLYFPEKASNGEKGDPNYNYGNDFHTMRLAKSACKQCPVINQCAEYALKHHEIYGIWGGMSFIDRKKIWKKGDSNA